MCREYVTAPILGAKTHSLSTKNNPYQGNKQAILMTYSGSTPMKPHETP